MSCIVASLEEPAAFAPLFERHFTFVHRYVQQRAGLDAADEIAAETFLVAFGRRDRFDGERASALPWLLGIATNLVRRHWRAERRQLAAYARAVAGEAASAARETTSAAPPLDGALAAALATLAHEDRDALLLFVWADLSYQEIAEALAVPIGTVRSRISRARRLMRERVEPQTGRGSADCILADTASARPAHIHTALTEEIPHG